MDERTEEAGLLQSRVASCPFQLGEWRVINRSTDFSVPTYQMYENRLARDFGDGPLVYYFFEFVRLGSKDSAIQIPSDPQRNQCNLFNQNKNHSKLLGPGP